MGGVLSVFVSRRTTRKIFVKPVRVSSHSYADQVDVDVLFSALLKLACVFEVKETLATSLTDEILNPAHNNFDDQFVAVERWIMKYGSRDAGSDLTAEEIDYLIQYVELYQPQELENGGDTNNNPNPMIGRAISSVSAVSDSERSSLRNTNNINDNNPLVCPYRSDLASFTGEIRNQEAKRLQSSAWQSSPGESTVNISFGIERSDRQALQQANSEEKFEEDGIDVDDSVRSILMQLNESEEENEHLVRCDSIRGISEDSQWAGELKDF